MLIPLLITGGVLGALVFVAPRVPPAPDLSQPAPVVTGPQQIDVEVSPGPYRAFSSMGNPARDAYLQLVDMGFTDVTFAGTSDPDLSRFAADTPVTFVFNVTGVPQKLTLPGWMRVTFYGRMDVPPPPTTTPAPSENLPPLPGTPATPPAGIPSAPVTRVQRLLSRAEALLSLGLNTEPMLLESVAAEITEVTPNHPLVAQLLQRAQQIRIMRAQGVP